MSPVITSVSKILIVYAVVMEHVLVKIHAIVILGMKGINVVSRVLINVGANVPILNMHVMVTDHV
jgi:hypothetical protein